MKTPAHQNLKSVMTSANPVISQEHNAQNVKGNIEMKQIHVNPM